MLDLAAALMYWVIVAIWLVVLGTVAVTYLRNPKSLGAARLLLVVILIDTLRNIIENVYFGIYWGGQFGLFSAAVTSPLDNAAYVIAVKMLNVVVGCLVLGVLLLRWLPERIKERAETNARLAEADKESTVLASALDGASSPILVLDAVDPRRPVVFANAAYLHRYGKTKAEVLGHPVNVAHHVDDPQAAAALALAIAQGHPHKAVVELREPEGHITTHEITLQPIFDNAGRTVLLTALCTDITALRATANDNAADPRSARERLVGQMAGAIAHDFNNLVTVMLGSLAAARNTLPPRSTESQAVTLGLAAAERSSRLARRLISYSRNIHTPSEAVDVNQTIENLSLLLTRAVASNVRVLLSLSHERAVCDMDVGGFEDALMNLVINASHALPNGGAITISTAIERMGEDPAAAAMVVVRVADNGVGMTADIQARAFERFFTTKERGQGSGLGLSLVRDFAEQTGGTVDLTSTLGVGTTVTLRLPLLDVVATPQAPGGIAAAE
jgi:PAS domain S-box-containing protein